MATRASAADPQLAAMPAAPDAARSPSSTQGSPVASLVAPRDIWRESPPAVPVTQPACGALRSSAARPACTTSAPPPPGPAAADRAARRRPTAPVARFVAYRLLVAPSYTTC